MNKEAKAILMLVLTTFIWGWTFPLIHDVAQSIRADSFVFWRFLIAGMIVFAVVGRLVFKTQRTTLVFGLVLAALNCGTYVLQTKGLASISAPRSAFITGTSVLMVPFLSPLFGLGRPGRLEIASGGLCLIGLYILTGAHLGHVSVGDVWTFGCALCVALTILVIKWAGAHTQQMGLLTLYQIALTALILALFQMPYGFTLAYSPQVWGVILFCALFATVLAIFFQVKYQQQTSASRAAVIFVLEPVFAGVISVFMGQVALSWTLVLGGLLVCVSIVLPEWLGGAKRSD